MIDNSEIGTKTGTTIPIKLLSRQDRPEKIETQKKVEPRLPPDTEYEVNLTLFNKESLLFIIIK